MAWVRKIVNGRERLVFVSGAVPKKTTTAPTKASQVPGYVSPKPKTTAPVSVTGKTKPKEPAVPTPVVSGQTTQPTQLVSPYRPAEPRTLTGLATGAVGVQVPRTTQLAGIYRGASLPQPRQTITQGLTSAVAGVPRTLGRAAVSLAAPIVGAGVGTAATLAGGGNLIQNILTASEQFRGAGRAALGQGAQPRTAQIPINTPESLGLYQGRPRLGGVGGQAIQGPSALDVFLGRQARATTPEELTAAVPRLQERLRVIGATPRQQAQGGAMAFMDGLGRGVLPDVMTDAVASYVIGPLGYGSIEELMRDLGFIPNPDAPGTWLRGEVVQPGGTGTGGGDGGGNGGGFSFIPSTIGESRGGRSAMGLVNWRI